MKAQMKEKAKPGVVVHTLVPAEADGSLWVWGQPGMYNKLQASQEHLVRPYLKK